MGLALARAIAGTGEDVLLCSARPGWPARPVTDPGCHAASLGELLGRSELVLLAVPFPVAVALASGPAGRVGAGRTLIDVTNPGFGSQRTVPPDISGGELIAEAAPTWHVAKAFNTVPAEQLGACRLAGGAVTVPVAGAPAAKADACALASRLGFAPLDVGGIEDSRHLESLAALLIRVSATHHLHGRVAIHIGQPECPEPPTCPERAESSTGRQP
jgi:predicted dinucleotide-binding enzyme